MADIVISIAAKVAELLVVPIKKHICYPFKYESNIEGLKKQLENLTNQRELVQHSVDEAMRQGDEIEEHVAKWMHSVDEFTKAVVKPIIDDQHKAGKLCSIGFCSNLMMRYSLSKIAAKTAKDGVNLLGEGKFNKVSYRPPLQRTTSIYTRGYEDFDSRKPIFQEIMLTLKGDNFNVIGVNGMGGVGKTTLVKRVVAQAIEDQLFDEVVMVDVTENPDIKNIQAQIADELGLKFDEESLKGRAARLYDRLKKEKRVLVVLDNIWAQLDLDAVGIPFSEEKRGSVTEEGQQNGRNVNMRQCKILLTSRDLFVLRDDMSTQRDFFLNILSREEAGNLFWKIVDDSAQKSDYDSIAVEIVKYCDGLPVAIATIANALKNKSLSEWNDALYQLRNSSPRQIKGMDAKVFSAIKLSYDFLESEEAKSLFLLCSLYNASSVIPIDFFLGHCMGLGLFQNVSTLEQGRNRLRTLINQLKASSLLLEGNANEFFKMHDIVHVVAMSIASTNKFMFNIQDVTNLKEMLEEKLSKEATAISLPYKDVSVLTEKLDFPKLNLLILAMKDASLQIPDPFFEGMAELKVLDLCRIDMLLLPSSLCRLKNLRTLYLIECPLGDIAIIGELKILEILRFTYCDIEQLPSSIRQLTRLRRLELTGCSKLKVISPNVISSLTQLEVLLMDDSFVRWEVEGQNNNASLAELKLLSRLTTLYIHVLDARIIPQDFLIFEKLESYRIFIGDVWEWSDNFESSRILKLELSISNFLGSGIKNLLKRTEDLYLDKLKGIKNAVYELNGEGFPQLKNLHIQNAPEIQYIINSIGRGLCNVFPKLQLLILHNLINLEMICHSQLTTVSFGELRILKIRKCDRLKHLFTFSMAKNLAQLEEIEVTDCKKLEEIIFKESEEQASQNERIGEIKFTQLRTLRLQCLPQLTSFGFNAFKSDTESQEIIAEDEPGSFVLPFSQNVELPCLKNLELSSINVECRWLDQFPAMSSCCQTLTSLTLEECSGSMKFLFSYSVVKSLVVLEKLEIRNCKSIEGIINTDELRGEENGITMVLPKLLNLQLIGLLNLTQLSSGNSVEFPSLSQLSVKDCSKLKTFVSSSTSTGLKQSKKVEEMNRRDDIHPLFDQKVVLSTLESLNLSSIRIQTIWHNQLWSMSGFQSLTKIIIDDCDNLKYVFSSSMVKSLMKIEVIQISNCNSMEEVIITEGERIGNTLFPKLYQLHLKHLPELTTFCNFTRNLIELRSLTHLWLENCPKMHTFVSNSPHPDMSTSKEEHMNLSDNQHARIQPLFNEMAGLPRLKFLHIVRMDNLRTIWHNELSFNSYTLKYFRASECNNVMNVFPFNMSGRLQKLEEVWILNCDSLEEIFELQAVSCEETEATTAVQLRKLVLRSLPNLKHVWSTNSQGLLSSENLVSIEVQSCDRLKSIFPASIARGLLQLEELWIIKCCMVEEVFSKEEEQAEAVPPHLVFPKLNTLQLTDLPRLKSFYPGLFISEWPAVKILEIYRCDKMEMLTSKFPSIHKSHGKSKLEEDTIQHPLFFVDKFAFPKVEQLALEWNWIVEEMLHGTFSEYSCNLKFIELINFSKQSGICPSCFLYTLPNLERLDVYYGFFEELFVCEGLDCKEKHVETPSKLSRLNLFYLKGSLNQWKENSLPCKAFRNLTTLKVLGFGYLESLLVSSFVSFHNLTTMEVSKCNIGLVNIMEVSVAKSLVQLTRLKISECKMIETIITHVRVDEMEDLIIFNHLKYLELRSLPRLDSFSSGNYTIEFPSLQRVIVRQCPNMKIFSQGALSTPRLHKIQITEVEEEGLWEGGLNTTIQKLFKDMIGFCEFQHLTMSEFPHLKEVWHGQFPVEVFCNLKSLLMDECISSAIIPGNLRQHLNSLEVLSVNNCGSIEVFDFEEINVDEDFKVLSQLSKFYLDNLPRLKHIWKKNHSQVLGFRNLKSMILHNCSSLRYIFTPSVVSGFLQLQELEIIKCAFVEEIITTEGQKDASIDKVMEERISNSLFPKLERLELIDLQRLGRFCNFTGDSIQLLSLAQLCIVNCPEMHTFVCNSPFTNILPRKEPEDQHNSDKKLHSHIQPLFDEKVTFPNLKKLEIFKMANLKKIWKGQLTPTSFCELEYFEVYHCHKLLSIFPSKMLGRLQKLKEMFISYCWMVEEIVSMEEVDAVPSILFPQLTSMVLAGLPRLKGFYPGLYTSKWQALKKLKVHGCGGVEILASQLQTHGESQHEIPIRWSLFLFEEIVFPSLEELTLDWNCLANEILHGKFSDYLCKLKSLVFANHRKGISNICPFRFLDQLPNLEKVEFYYGHFKDIFVIDCKEKHVETHTKLSHLMLCNAYDWNYLWEENSECIKALQNLATLEVSKCPYIKIIVPASVSFKNLTCLEVSKCEELINLVAFSTAKSLVQLTRMTITDCRWMKDTIAHTGDTMEDQIIFKQLKYLRLQCLTSLESFYSGNYTIEFPSLEQVVLRQCPNMKIFSQGVLNTPKLQRVQMIEADVGGCWNGNLNATVQKLFKDMFLHERFSKYKFGKNKFTRYKRKLWTFTHVRTFGIPIDRGVLVHCGWSGPGKGWSGQVRSVPLGEESLAQSLPSILDRVPSGIPYKVMITPPKPFF
ncbi:hypothetical protein Ddye_028169 [Dipteronia dyeriana]|uniref:AAA+ ATPase domain-containing protein n=1 Tax=Dipteronia dyeriana TaxID=168575 RepID=A0AAD9TQG7_9ROSI|nr:hypothetical protein Ddye_028169 [Dipteronia dyeriana]